MKPRVFFAIAIGVIAVLAFFGSRYASNQPDGLNRVAIDNGIGGGEQPRVPGGSPTAGYAVRGVDDSGLSTGLAGLIGVTVTFGLATGLFFLVRRTRHQPV